MRTIDLPLINHAPRTVSGGTPVALADLGHDAAMNRSDRNVVGDAGDGRRDPPAVSVPGKSLSVVSLGHVEWMRPPDHALAPATNPGETALVTPEQTLAYPGVQLEESETADCVNRFAVVLARRHGISKDAALALALAALSAAAGPGRTLLNPLGGTVSNGLNVIVENVINARIRRASRQAVRPLQQKIDARILAHQMKGAKHLRQLQMELEGECARAIHRLRSPPNKSPEPLCIPLPAEERAKEALSAAADEAEPVAQAMQLHEFEQRPFLVTDGLTTRDIADLPKRTFDGAIFNYSPGGDALRQLEAMQAAHRRDVLRFMVAAWHGESFRAGAETIIAPTLSNLWLCDIGDTMRSGRNPAVATSGWLETVLMVANDADQDVAIDGCAATEVDDDWCTLINVVVGERIMGKTCEHELSGAAAKRFVEFHADVLRRQTASTQKFTAWWPEQVLKITLLLHLDALHSEVPKEISLATLENAITSIERLGAAQHRMVQSSVPPQDDFDAQIEVMTAKIRVNGPMPKWSLFRRYHSHRAEVMEPVLAKCCERKLLRVENDLVRLADAAP